MRKMIVSVLTLALASSMTGSFAAEPGAAPAPEVSLDRTTLLDSVINVPGGTRSTSLSVADESLRSVLRNLALQGGFNLVMDESVSGNVTIELDNVTINQALQAVAALGNVQILKQAGGIYLAVSSQAAQDKGLARQLSKVVKIYYSNAGRVADVLNRSLFAEANASASGGGGGQQQAARKVSADSRTNSVVIVGTAREIELAEAAISELDVPRQSKTFYLSHANALDVAALLAGSIFNDGTASLGLGAGGGSSSGGSGAGGAQPSTLRVEQQTIEEGSGISSFGGGSGSSGSLTSGLSSSVTLRGTVKSSSTATISPEGPMVVPDTRQNAVTIMGTAEQIALAESLIPTLDAQLPQVSIEASLIEITEAGVKELGTRLGIADGRLQSGFNNTSIEGVSSAGSGTTGMPTVDPADGNARGRSGIVFSTNPANLRANYTMQIRSLITRNKARILANPTIVATHDTESIISIVDEVVRRVTTQLDPSGFATQTVEIGEAGIVLDILPQIGEDGTVSMRLRPSVTSVLEEREDAFGNLVTLLSKRDMLTQNVRVRDGETLVIGGLIQESDNITRDKFPLAGDLPIVGAMFRSSARTKSRSELVLLITPHILNKTRLTPTYTTSLLPGGDQ